jgi:hypothetical protein
MNRQSAWRGVSSALVLAGALLAAPSVARADGFLSPQVAVNFGGNTTKETIGYGGALGFMGRSAGFEFDVNYTPEFFGDDTLDVDGKLLTVMGNVIIGGRRGGFSPYFAFGAGLIRTSLEAVNQDAILDVNNNSWGGNVGAGFFAGGGGVALRGDVRYYRAFNFDEGFDLDLDIVDDTLGFWRGTVGVAFMW